MIKSPLCRLFLSSKRLKNEQDTPLFPNWSATATYMILALLNWKQNDLWPIGGHV